MSLEAIKYTPGCLQILDQLCLPNDSKYVDVKSVEDGWNVINKMQVSRPNVSLGLHVGEYIKPTKQQKRHLH